ncbi:phage tail protein [Riemerella anatipestifer]
MKYNILRNNNVITMVRATGSLTEKLFGEETLTLDFTLPHFVLFRIGDSVEVYGKTYYISQEPVVNKKSSREYVYNLVFNGEKYRLAEVQYFFYDENNNLTMPEFSITATAQKMVELLVANANRTQTGWSVGNIDSTETKTIDFSEYNCLAALTRIAEDFGLEFWVDEDKSIHLEERKKVSGYTLEYGKSKGLKSITRNPYTESSLVTRLYARGSSRNIPKNYRNGQKVLRMPVPFLEKNTDKYGIVEHTQPFEDIYPKRVGTVTQVYADNPLKFSDSTLDFDLNEYNEYGNTIIQKGISAKVIFQTGDLAGYTLEVKEYGFDSVTKTFTLLKNQDEKSFDIPSDTFRPQVGDKYIIIDIAMPKSYVDNAEQELQAAAQDYLDKNSKQRFVYAVEPDPIYLKKINFNLKLGHTIRFKDSDFGLDDDIRVISITRNINNPYDISFEISEQATITQIVRNYIEKEKAQTAIKKQQKYNAEMARRSFLFAEEIKNNVFDNEGYFDTQKIKPLSIETGMLSVGSRMQQFSLPNIALSITSDNKRLHNTAGQMVHLTIDPNAPRTWNLAENTTVQFSDNFNFIYIKADKIGSNATIVVTEQKILFDSDPIFYFFLAGSVSSIINGVRRIKTSYGYTQITPSEITTGRIASPNGSNYIDLKQDGIEINAKVTFAGNSPAIQQAVDAVSVGGRNYLRGSQKGYGMFNNNGRTLDLTQGEENGVKWISGTSVNNGNFYISTYFHLLNNISVFTEDLTGQETIQSVEVKPTHDMYIGFGENNRKFCPANVWTKIENSPYNNTRFMGIYAIWNNDGSVPATAKIYHRNWKLEKGNKATDWTPAPEDIQSDITRAEQQATQASNAYAQAQANLAKTQAEAYADGKVSKEEQRAIADAQQKLQLAKEYAQAQDNLKETLIKAYADGKADKAEQSAIAVAEAKANLARLQAEAHADSIVTAEEQARINEAKAKLEEAKAHAQTLVNAVSVGGRNLVRESNVFRNGISADGIGSNITSEGYLRVISSISNNNWHTNWFSRIDEIEEQMTEGEAFTITFWVKRLSGYGKPTIYLKDGMGYFYLKGELNNSEFKPLSYIGTWKKAKSLHPHLGWASANGEFIIKCWKIEKGNKATDWTPSPEDVQAEINAVKAKADQLDNLGTMAWQNSVEKAMLGSTIVQGGYIKTELLNASAIVSNGGGATTTQLNNAINGIIVGGRNLILNSKRTVSSHGYHITNIDLSSDMIEGEEYCLTIWASVPQNQSIYVGLFPSTRQITSAIKIADWVYFSKFIFRKNPHSPNDVANKLTLYNQGGNDYSTTFFCAKLEKGNKPSDWTPAPEDIDAQFANLQQGISNMQTSLSDVKTKTDNFASIQGGLMMANLMSVGSNQANQNAFISGITDEGAMSVRFGAGSNYANKHNAPFRVLDNGKMIAKDADITGRITATGGNIGDWEINGSSFRSSSIGSNDSWAQYSSYAFFSPETFLIRKNGSERGETKEVMMGITSSISTGSEGAAAAIKSNIKKTQYDFDRDNVALRLEAKNGVTNTALDILNGDIRVGGEVGYTGELFLGGVWLTIRKGIITNYS